MFRGQQFLALAIILVLLLFASFIVGSQSISSTSENLEDGSSSNLSDYRQDTLARLQIDENQAQVPSSAKPILRKILIRNEYVVTKLEVEVPTQVQKISITAEEKTTRETSSANYNTSVEPRKDISVINEQRRLKKTNVKNHKFYGNIDFANVFDLGSWKYKSKKLSNQVGDETSRDPSDLSVRASRDKKRVFEYNRFSSYHHPKLHKHSKRDVGNFYRPSPTSFENLKNKDLIHYEPSAQVSVVPLDVTKSEIYKRNNDTNTPNTKNELARQQTPTVSAPATKNRHIRARKEGDAILGALFPLHLSPSQNTAYTRQCGEIWENYGIQRVETFLLTVESINRDSTILPHIKLGWDIRDSCWYPAIALENSIDFIKDTIASQSKVNNTDSSMRPLQSGSGVSMSTSSSSSTRVSTTASRDNDATQMCKGNKNLKPIIGLVGPGSSESTIQVQNLLQIFNIPQIGYSATSHDLSDKNHYKYFLRVVPPDRYQAQAMVDILLTFNWTYVSTLHTDGNYGLKGMTLFTDLAKPRGICFAAEENVASSAEDAAFDNVLENLLKEPNASVVVCFCEGTTVRNLFKATRRKKMERRLLIFGSDGWGNRLDVVEGLESEAAGMISIMLHSPPFQDFGPHYAKLQPHSAQKNPWFDEFWEYKFKCSLDKKNLRGHTKACAGNESLAGAQEDSKLGFVANAVITLARGLHNMHQDLCPGSEGLCRAMEPLNGSVYLQYLLNVSFQSYSNEEVHFDAAGDPPGRYEILNYQPLLSANGSAMYDYVTIGYWTSGALTLDIPKVYWPQGSQVGDGELKGIINSVCSEPCMWNEAKKVKGMTCCWICTACLENEILVDNNTDCKPCDLGMWPNINKTDCEAIPIDFIHWSHTQAIVCISLGGLGISVTLWVFATFIRYHNTSVVKASTRELSYILLVGICLAFSANFFIVSKPAKEVCYMTRILPGLSFSLMYGALVTRTNRIARILEGSKRIMTKKPKFMSATAQVVITGMIIGIECAVITAILVYQPADARLDYSTPKKVRLICDTSTLGIVVPLGFDLILILLCTIYAVKTRNLPENFNEAKFIGFTMYSTCIIWLGFFPIYFAGENKEITLSISVSLSAAIALVLLFMPKVYVIVWVPEKNTRGAFTTSRDVRCHIGSKSINSGDSAEIRFVIQRTGCSDEETPYINHGVLANHSNPKSASFVDIVAKEHCKTDSTTTSTHSCPDKERIFHKESREMSSAEVIRQNLARDFPMHKPPATLRPGSPSEKEKHRIHNVNNAVDFDELQGIKVLHVHGRVGRPGEIRKSLSSTCVSTYPITVSVQCQTTDDLVNNSLPPLRRRCVSSNKNKLERSEAVEDFTGSVSRPLKFPTRNNTKSLPIQRSCESPPSDDYFRHSPPEISETFPLMVSNDTCDDQDFLFVPEMMTTEESSLLDKDHMQLRDGSNTPVHHSHYIVTNRHISSDSAQPSPILPLSAARFNPAVPTSNRSFASKTEYSDKNVNPLYNTQRGAFFRHLHKSLPEPGVSPSSQNVDGSHWYQDNDISVAPLTHQDSRSSTSVSIASSSSFTLPPFRSSTDSNPSQQTFDDSYNSLDLEQCNDTNQNNVCGNDKRRELIDIHQSRTSQNQTDYSSKSKGTNIEAVTVETLNKNEDEVLEFQRYLQGHGVKLEFPTVQTSDL